MSLFFHNKPRGVTVAVMFDIGSASVGGSLALLRAGQRPHILYSTRRHMVFQTEFNFDRFVASMLSTLEAVARDIERNGLTHLTFPKHSHRRIDWMFCSYASPWYLSQTRIIDMTHDKPFVLSEEVVEHAIREQESKMTEAGGSHYGGGMGEHIDMLERAVTDIKVNGYTVTNPYGKRATSAQFTLTVSVIARALRERVEEVLERVFRAERLTHHSFALAAFGGISQYLKAPQNFLAIDVSGEVTDVALVHRSALLETVSLPQGTRHNLRALNRSLGVSSDEARTLLGLWASHAVSAEVKPSLDRALDAAKTEWLIGLGEALARFDSDAQIPTEVFLTTDDWAGTLFSSFIQDEAWARYTRTHRPLSVTFVSGSLLQPFITFREGVATDPFLALITLYMDAMTQASHARADSKRRAGGTVLSTH